MRAHPRIAAIAAVVLAGGCAAPAASGPGPVGGPAPAASSAEGLAATLAGWKARCEHGFAIDCRRLGRAWLNGTGVPADVRLGAALLMKGCEIGEPASCSDLGVLTVLGRGVAQDDVAGVALSRRACEAGHALACSNLATLEVEGVNRPAPRPEADGSGGTRTVGRFLAACEAGGLEGCLNLGTALERGQLAARDLPGAGRALRRACEGGLPIACHRLALLATRTPEAAPGADVAALEAVACRAGIVPACTRPGEAPGPPGPLTPTPRLVAEPSTYALGIPGAGGFHPTDLAQAPARRRGPRGPAASLPAGQLAGLPEQLRRRLGVESRQEAEVKPDEPVELLLRLRRGQLGTCLERDRSHPSAVRLAASFLVEEGGRPGRTRAATEPVDPELETCAAEVIGAWTFPLPASGASGPHLVRFDFEAAPPGPPPVFAATGGLRPALREAGCVERNLRVPAAHAGAGNSVTVKLVVGQDGRPALFHAITPAPEPLVAAVGEAVRACAFSPGVDGEGRPLNAWLTLTVRLDRR